MEFFFRITQYNADELEDEVAVALEKQLEINSRKRLPDIWRFIDRNNSRRALEGIIKKRSILRRIYGILLTGMGIFLLVPGLTDPRELMIPLFTGIICVVVGVGCIWPWRRRSNRKFHKLAKKLLAGMKRSLNDNKNTSLLVRFTAEGMMLPNDSMILYQNFQTIIEVNSIYFLVWLDKVTILQKKDLAENMPEDYLSFLEEMTGLHRIIIHNR